MKVTEHKRMERTLLGSQEQQARSHQFLLALSRAVQAVQGAPTPEEVYRRILDEVARLGYHATIFTLMDDGAQLSLSHLTFESALVQAAQKLVGLSAEGYGFRLVPGGFYDWVLSEGKAVFVERAAESVAEALPRAVRPLAGRLAAMLGLRQAIHAPLTIRGENYGLLTVLGEGLTEGDIPAVTAFANQIALALENARLYHAARQELSERKRAQLALRERVKELTGLYAVTRDAQRQISLEEFCSRVLENLTEGMQFPEITVSVIDVDDMRFVSEGYSEKLSHGLRSEIRVGGRVRGRLSVYYSEDRPFILPEEQSLVDAIAEAAGHWVELNQAQAELEESEAKYRVITESTSDLIALANFDLNPTYTYASPSYKKHLGYEPEHLIGEPVLDLVHPRDKEYLLSLLARYLVVSRKKLLSRETPDLSELLEYRLRDKSGNWRWVQSRANLVDKELLLVSRDISERRQAEEALRQSEERYRTLFQDTRDAINITTREGQVLDANQSFLDLFGYTREEIAVLNAEDLYVDPAGRRRFQEEIERKGSVRDYEVKLRKKDGSEMNCLVTSTVRRHDDGSVAGYQGFIHDITERKRVEETIKRLAYHDPLTGLPNRMLFSDRLRAALPRARRNKDKLAVMLLDLDHFKNVNDRLGHPVGDELLQAVAERLTALLRESDTICRMGGDEFLVLLEGIAGMEDVGKVADAILEAVRGPFVLKRHKLHVTTSLGIAIYPDDGEDGDTLIKNADIAMYLAKEKGRDNYQRYIASEEGKSTPSSGGRRDDGRA